MIYLTVDSKVMSCTVLLHTFFCIRNFIHEYTKNKFAASSLTIQTRRLLPKARPLTSLKTCCIVGYIAEKATAHTNILHTLQLEEARSQNCLLLGPYLIIIIILIIIMVTMTILTYNSISLF